MTTLFAFLFPGQGSQSLGMLSDIAAEYSIIKSTFDEASQVLEYDLWELTQQGPEDKLNSTEHTQPALLTASIALWRICQSHDLPTPTLLAGHSLGEYSALVVAQSLSFTDAVTLVRDRGRFMQHAVKVGEGAMAAILGLDDKQVKDLCEQHANNQIVAPANFNSVGQVVISGEKTAVERVVEAAKPAGAKIAKLIPVSVPSHCKLMQPASEHLTKALEQITITSPQIPVIHNVNVDTLSHPDDIKHALIAQLTSPVRWVETIQTMIGEGITDYYECGPNKVLAGLNKRIDKSIQTTLLSDLTTLKTVGVGGLRA